MASALIVEAHFQENIVETNVENHPRLKYYDLIGMAFVAVVLISSITASKLIAVGSLTFTSGIILFPLAYIFGDCLTEVYGFARARRIVWAGFAANLFMSVVISITIILPPASGWLLQEQYAAILGQVPRIVFASLIAYLCGEFANSITLAKMKVWTNGRHLWMRTIGSTIVGEGVDTVLFVLIAFWGILPTNLLFTTIVSAYLFKVMYEVLATPFTYYFVRRLKQAEGVDHYDRSTNFTPFRF